MKIAPSVLICGLATFLAMLELMKARRIRVDGDGEAAQVLLLRRSEIVQFFHPKGRRIIFECQTYSGCCGSRSFCGGSESFELSRLAQALEVNEGLMEQILKNLEAQLDERGSGLCLLCLGNRYQLCTHLIRSECPPGIGNQVQRSLIPGRV